MSLSDQINGIKRGFDISNHTFFNRIAAAIAEKIKADTGLEVKLVGKVEVQTEISGSLVGQSFDAEKNEEIEERVRQTMQGLKNPTALIDLLR